MAYKYTSTFLALLLISNVLLATGRYIPMNSQTQPQDMKEPEWFLDSGDHAYIPGIGRVKLPPKFKLPYYYYPYTGGNIGGEVGAGSGPTGRGYVPSGGGFGAGSGHTDDSYVPGGDDTFVPNPGYEVPYPGTGGGEGGAPGTPAFP